MNKPVSLALDVMSGENDPHSSIEAALKLISVNESVNLHLIGNKEKIKECLPRKIDDRLSIQHTEEVITMNDSPMDVLRRKKQSSMRLAVELVANKKADACISSGNTGALLAISKHLLKTIPNIRPGYFQSKSLVFLIAIVLAGLL